MDCTVYLIVVLARIVIWTPCLRASKSWFNLYVFTVVARDKVQSVVMSWQRPPATKKGNVVFSETFGCRKQPTKCISPFCIVTFKCFNDNFFLELFENNFQNTHLQCYTNVVFYACPLLYIIPHIIHELRIIMCKACLHHLIRKAEFCYFNTILLMPGAYKFLFSTYRCVRILYFITDWLILINFRINLLPLNVTLTL
jgi:hypothetical protein